MRDWANRATSYQYFPDGLPKKVTNVNGTTMDYTYDNSRRVTGVTNASGSLTVADVRYPGLDSAGQRTASEETLAQPGPTGGSSSASLAYRYSPLRQLVGADRTSGGTTSSASWVYDGRGNRNRAGSESLAFDRTDRISSASYGSYGSDANGNTTARPQSGSSAAGSFRYDQANRLTSANMEAITGTTTLAHQATYVYDGDGVRTSKTVDGVSTGYVQDRQRSLPVVLEDGGRRYVWGLGLSYATSLVTGDVEAVYHADGLGSVRALTDGAGAVTASYSTDPWGSAMAGGLPEVTPGQPFRYTGEQADAETGLLHLRARQYDPSAGRLLQQDRVPGQMQAPTTLNRYAYVLNNPVNYVDPSGNCPMCAAPAAPVVLPWLAASASVIGAIILAASEDAQDAVGDAAEAAAETIRGVGLGIEAKIRRQMGPRGWSEGDIQNALENPDATDPRINLRTGGPATCYHSCEGGYVVVDDTTGQVIQVSNRNDPGWKHE